MAVFQIDLLLTAVAMIAGFTLAGAFAMLKFIELAEAQHEMRARSPSLLRRMRGWSFVAIWVILTAYAGSFIGDWAKSGDLDGAQERSLARAEIIVQVIAMIMSSDQ